MHVGGTDLEFVDALEVHLDVSLVPTRVESTGDRLGRGSGLRETGVALETGDLLCRSSQLGLKTLYLLGGITVLQFLKDGDGFPEIAGSQGGLLECCNGFLTDHRHRVFPGGGREGAANRRTSC